MRPGTIRLVLLLICAVIVISSGCSSRSETTSTTETQSSAASRDGRTLRPVALPDLSRVSQSVQQQLRDGYRSLTARMGNPGSTDAELGLAYGEMGTLLMAAEYRDAAEPCLLNAQALVPTEIKWPYYLAHLYKVQGNSAKATTFFEQALRSKPDDVATLVWLGNGYLDQGRPADAEPVLMKALALQPRSVPALFGLGRVALAKQDDARAVGYFEQALSLDPKAVTIHYQLAMAYRGLGDLGKADAHMRQRAPGEIRPPDPLMQELNGLLASPVAYEVRGARALDDGQWAAAAEYFRKGIELAPDEPSLRHKLGTALAMVGDAGGAFQQFEEVTRRWPKFAKARYSLGVMLAGAGRYHEAIEHFSAAVSSEPGYVEAHLQLAEALRASRRFEQSLAEYDETVRLDPRVAQARFGSAQALASLGRYQQARARLMEGVKLHPDRPEFAEALARLPAEGPE